MSSLYDNGGFLGYSPALVNNENYILESASAAPAFVGASVENKTQTSSGVTVDLTGLTGGSDSSPSAGDIIILVCMQSGSSTLNNFPATAPSDYTLLGSIFRSDTYSSRITIWYKLVGDPIDESVTISFNLSSSTWGSSTVAYVWRGVDQLIPVDFSEIQTTGATNSSNANPPQITPTIPNSMIIVGGGSANNRGGVGFSSTPGLSNTINTGANSTYDSSLAVGSIGPWTSGSVNPSAFSQSTSTSFSWAAFTMAIRPANVYGNLKNSGMWSLKSTRESKIPRVVVSDSFTNADNTDILNHTPEGNYIGSNYIKVSTLRLPEMAIISNRLLATSADGVVATGGAVINSGFSDVIVEAELNKNSSSVGFGGTGLLFRCSKDGYLRYIFDATTSLRLRKFEGQVETTLGISSSLSVNNTSTYNFKVVAVGSLIQCYVNNVLYISVNDSSFTGTHHGVGITGESSTLGSYADNLKITGLG